LPHRARSLAPGLVLLVALAGCGAAPSASTTREPPASAASSPDVSASVEPSGDAAEATVVADAIVSTDDEEYRISFAPDGGTAYFARGRGFFPQSREATIYETTLVDGAWSQPTVAAFSGTYPDLDPWVAPDGGSIYFSSIRPVGDEARSDVEIFRVDRVDGGWGEPVHLAALGSDADELGASVSEDGAIWFASDRPGGAGGWDLYRAVPEGDGFGFPEPIDDINSNVWEFNPAIDAAGTTLVFTSISRPGGSGLGDLFVSTLEDEAWAEPEPLAINTPADEYHPSRSPDGETLYFLRRAADGDLYEIPWSVAAPAG
jgi:WD40-like Beta Propeller Repeat